MSLWVRRLTGSTGASLLAGTAYAFLPFHFAHFLIGHLNLSGLQWFPLFFWGFFDLLLCTNNLSEESRHSEKDTLDSQVSSQTERDPSAHSGFRMTSDAILKTGIGLGLIALTSQYYLYHDHPDRRVYLGGLCGFFQSYCSPPKIFLDGLVESRAGCPAVWSPSPLRPYVSLAGQGELPDRELGIVRPYSAGLTDFLLPSTDHFLWGSWVGSHFNRDMWVEGTLYVGLVNMVLAVFAWVNRKKLEQKTILILMLVGGALALLLAMGTDLHWNGAPVEIPTPAFLQGMYSKPTIPIPLPGLLLFKYFPFYAKLRALMRFGIFVLLFICAAAGLGAAELLKRISPQLEECSSYRDDPACLCSISTRGLF